MYKRIDKRTYSTLYSNAFAGWHSTYRHSHILGPLTASDHLKGCSTGR